MLAFRCLPRELAFVGLLFACHGSAQQCRLRTAGKQAPFGVPTTTSSIASQVTTATSASPTASSTMKPFNYGQDTIRGVNLGGWFVLEPWITPSIFQNTNDSTIIDEYTLGGKLDNDVALNVLQTHWETWITEDDFADIAAAGLTHVRLPYGYWSVPMTSEYTSYNTTFTPYIPGAWPYLIQALSWAQKHGIRVILDLHGAPGSQNGYDNSGQRTSNPQWENGSDRIQLTLDIIDYVASNLAGAVDVIELLNEAAGFRSSAFASAVKGYFSDGYTTVRNSGGSQVKVMIGDAFLGVQHWNGFLTYPDAQGVLMDWHEYQIFSDKELARSLDEHIDYACGLIPNVVDFAESSIWTVVGEWSTSPTDCAEWLNGRGIGSRWDGTYNGQDTYFGSCDGWTGNMSTFSDDYKTFLRKYWEVQVQIGESVQGWIYWTWKTESTDEWSYLKGLEGGWIPQDPTDRLYPDICS